MSKCKRPVEIRELLYIFSSILEGVQKDNEVFIEAKKTLGNQQYNVLMNTLMFIICSKCMAVALPKSEYEEFTKSIMVEVEKCDPSKVN